MTADALPWLILGAGRAGRMLALWAAQLGLPVAATWSRSASSASVAALTLPHILQNMSGALPGALSRLPPRPYMVWITVADDAIAPCAAAIAAWLPEGSRVAHMAGSLPSSILSDAGITAPVASLHPLLAIADPHAALAALATVTWTLEGDAEACAEARRPLDLAHITPLHIEPAAKVYYHAAAVTAANLLVSLVDAAYAMAAAAGIDQPQARAMLLPLVRSCLDNLATKSPAEALTGPASRGDLATIARHHDALSLLPDPQLAAIYDLLIQRALALAGQR
jgi:predicted short-subunit dehydrogenase-like oxidoreductase (DUF2520 family)